MKVGISKRLREIANLVPAAETVADIGCDHGLLCIYLIQTGRVQRAIATDIGEGPLKSAENNIRDFGLSERITVRLSDGLRKIAPGEAEVIVIAGMGGRLMLNILKAGEAVWRGARAVILSPQRDELMVREYMCNRAKWDTDVFFTDEGKHYTVMRFLPGEPPRDIAEKQLILGLNPTEEYLSHVISQNEKILLALECANASEELSERREELIKIIGMAKNEG